MAHGKRDPANLGRAPIIVSQAFGIVDFDPDAQIANVVGARLRSGWGMNDAQERSIHADFLVALAL